MVAAIVYSLCTLTCLGCFGLLLRGWLANRSRILFWSALCFAGLSANNFLLVIDKLVFLSVDLSLLRLWTALLAMLLLLFGLLWGEE
jgi:phosphatidylserine synthase